MAKKRSLHKVNKNFKHISDEISANATGLEEGVQNSVSG